MITPVLGVFVPGLMGAGLLVSMGLLVADGVRKLRPARGERTRALLLATRAQGRVRDLTTVRTGEAPAPMVVPRAVRPPAASLALGVLAAVIATALVWGAVLAYATDGTTLSGRGWTIGAGIALAGLPAEASLVWILSGLLGRRRPPWLDRLARVGVLGAVPDPPPLLTATSRSDSGSCDDADTET